MIFSSPLNAAPLFPFAQNFGWNLRKRSELLTTETELNAMAAEAIMGFRRIPQKG